MPNGVPDLSPAFRAHLCGAEKATPARLGRRQGGDSRLYSKIHLKTKGIVEPVA
jgi:hypothetical protein